MGVQTGTHGVGPTAALQGGVCHSEGREGQDPAPPRLLGLQPRRRKGGCQLCCFVLLLLLLLRVCVSARVQLGVPRAAAVLFNYDCAWSVIFVSRELCCGSCLKITLASASVLFL